MRDSWITVANRYEFLDVIEKHGAPSERPRNPAGRYIPYPVSRSLERRRDPDCAPLTGRLINASSATD
jgi:hypothetical protein